MRHLEGTLCLLAVAMLSACRTETSFPTLALPVPAVPVAGPELRADDASVAVSRLSSRWTPERIHEAEFFPEDASEILELHPMPKNLRSEVTQFPSVEESCSPRGNHLLRCVTSDEGDGRKHRLMLEDFLKRTATTIWTADLPFEVMWSQEGDAVAINQDMGGGRVDVFVYFMLYERTYALPNVFPGQLDEILSPAQLRSGWDFRALGWEPRQGLIVRGVGRDDQEPYQDYGHEFAVHFTKGHGPTYPPSLIRAYRRERAGSDSVR